MSEPPIRELPRPAAVPQATASADQILSVWIVDAKELAAVFPPALYGEDVWKWGRLLAILARYIAHAHAKAAGGVEADALEAIRLNFDEALRSGPGEAPPGSLTQES